jgi:amino acid adenylation domain-containing protein
MEMKMLASLPETEAPEAATATGLPLEKCLHELFDAQAERTPDAPALVAGSLEMTYRELRDRAQSLTRHLRAMGVGPEAMVGVCMERTAEMVPALLGVLKAGGVYVPMDPAYPAQRLGFMLEDASVSVLLTQERLLGRLPGHRARVLCLDGEEPASPEEDPPRRVRRALPGNLAYLIYTSGSTGRPKGVAIQHRSAAALISWAARVFGPERLRGVLASTSISFDLSIFEIFVPLSLGGTVILAENALRLPELPARDRVTLVNTVPSAIAELLRTGGLPAGVTTVNLAGEALSGALVRKIYEQTAADRVYNLYGPSEDTTYSTFAWIERGETAPPSIGRPIAGTEAWILDQDGQPVPVGVEGEIYLAGHGLARGYLGRPELTAERFVPDSFGGQPGERLYRTGDLGRYRPDGEIEFLGRIDHQVKIRGFRIELGEIEAELERLPAVERALVTAKGPAGEQRLIAYASLRPGMAAPTVSELRSALGRSLPAHMVPGAFVLLDAFPLLPNGKIDRGSLPEPGPERPELAAAYVAPRNETEAALATIWGQVLGIEGIGVHDGFFELGGHSLSAGRVTSRVREALGVELAPADLFAAPTIAALAARMAEAPRAGGALLRAVPRDRDLPLSFPQQRLWFLDRLTGRQAVYNIPYLLRLTGRLDRGALVRSLREIVQRHEALRTSFTERDGLAVQRIAPRVELEVPAIDLRLLPESEREAEAWAIARREACEPFDLSRPPLLRASLLRLGEGEHALVLVVHHIVADGWSMEVLVRELAALYGSRSLPALPVQPADVAMWQREELAGERLKSQIAWWRERLAGLAPVLPLPTDRPRPAAQSFRGAAESVEIPQALYRELEALARQEGATLYMILLAAFATLLRRYTGQDDVAVGTPGAGRSRAELEGVVGLLVNMLVLRTDVGGDPTFRELLARVKGAAVGVYAHQDVPFERLVEELAPERTLSHNPLFQVSFSVDRVELDADLDGVALRSELIENGTAKFDLSLYLLEERGGLRALAEYATDLFEADTVRRMLANLETLLAGIAADPGRRLSELPSLAPAEWTQVVETWNATAVPFPREAVLQELFEAQAERTPQALAVTGGAERWTYRELNEWANRLAWRLRRLGVGPEATVAVWLDRSPEMVAALLAVVKTGGAYLPLDPAWPAERVALVMEDSGAVALITREFLEAQRETLARESLANPPRLALLENLAYVIYTSGSTGRPKGVGVRHTGLVNLIRWHQRTYGVTPADRATQIAGPAFDASVWELWPYLTAGASVHIPAEELRTDPARLVAWLVRKGITLSFLSTPMAEVVMEQPWPEHVALRALLTGGDRLNRAPAPGLPFELVNHYGPTEGTVLTTFRPVPAGEAGAPPIGRPLDNVRTYVLDRSLRPVPLGAMGELFVGGEGVARGYLGQPAMTAASFVPDPFAAEPGARLYRTGDLVRQRPDGEIEFLGRADHQVKIRGFRVELGEIEAVLAQAPGVREAVVLVRESGSDGSVGSGGGRLVAYVTGEAGAEGLRSFLESRLPGYMVPSAFVRLESFPLTTNGKVDRRALPAPDPEERAGTAEARTPFEEVVAAVWAEVLGLERVGVDESFFELGGHSLSATRVVSRLRDLTGSDLPVRALFEHPTVSALAREVAAALAGGPGEAAPPLVPVPRDSHPPLSFAQQRLWFLAQLAPDSPFYNTSAALDLQGPLDAAALARACNEIVRRHEALRTTFATVDGSAVQVIAPAAPVAVPEVDLRGLPVEDREREAERLALEEAGTPFDLVHGPLLRLRLLRLDAERSVLVLNTHHIVSDDWSLDVFVRELAALYRASVAGGTSPLPELPFQYADFAVWQREWLAGPVLERQLSYWTEQLAGAPPVHELMGDRPRPAVQSFRGGMVPFALPRELSADLRALSREEGVTLFMKLLAAWKALLLRATGRGDLVVGSPIANRNRSEIEGLIGFFVNMLALRTRPSGDWSVGELLAEVREVSLAAYAHQDLPFEKLVEALDPERDLSRNPLFQLSFVLQNAAARRIEMTPDLRLSRREVEAGVTRFDLTLFLWDGPEGITGSLDYSADLFDAATAARMAGHLETLLAGMVAGGPDRRLADLPLLTAAEEVQILEEWNATDAAVPEACLHELFAAQAERTPAATALIAGEERLSYAGLRLQSLRLARLLAGLGVGPEVRVAVALERTADLIVALLAVLESGGAYVPLDPAYPAERIALLLEDAGAPVLVTQESLLGRLPRHEARVVCLDRLESDLPAADPVRALPDNLAYLIYTSGSTGRPKGVAIEHRSAVALVAWAAGVFGPERLGGVLAATSVCFDLSVFEIFVPLAVGGTVILAENALALPELPAAGEVTLVNTVPSALTELVRSGGVPAGVRTVNLAGEPLPGSLVRQIYERTAVEAVYNLYGPSEDTTYSTFARIARGAAAAPAIGRPVANTRAYVLDAFGNPVPVGVPGELYLAGAGLARGYLDRPELTAGRFVPDPWSPQPGGRLYRTGDLVRYRPDGDLEFLGRLDHQVKVRGFRIELGEVEAALEAVAGVREAVVVARADGSDGSDGSVGSRLVAYVVGGTTAEVMRAALRAALPEYMVPSAFVALEAFPLTPNGKIDRRALPAPEPEPVARGAERARTPLEEVVAAVWAQVLGREELGLGESFFDLGGHSLTATQVVSRLRDALGVDLSVRALFEEPTIEGLARKAGAALAADSGLAAPPLVPVPREGNLPLSFAQQRLWFLAQLVPDSPFYNMPAALHLTGPLDIAALSQACDEIVRRHEILRTTFPAVGGKPAQVIGPAFHVPLPQADLSALPPEAREREAGRLALEEARTPFDLVRGPLLRALLVRMGEGEHVLVLNIHHIASDGWSITVFSRELAALYRAFAAGQPSPLPELPLQYVDFAVWQREWLAGPVLESQLAWWKEQLDGAPPVHDFLGDRPRPAVQSYRGALLPIRLPRELSQRLRDLGRGEGATLFMLLLAAWKVLLLRATGREDLVVGSPIANRNRSEIEGLVGFFVNLLVLRTKPRGGTGFRELLAGVREVSLAAYAHQDLPFEKLVEELDPERDLSRNPLCQIVFALQNATARDVELAPGLTLERREIDWGTTRFDLTLFLWETPEGLAGLLDYSTDLYDAATMARTAGHLEVLLAGLAAEPDRPVATLPLLAPAEREELLGDWTRTATAYPRHETVTSLFTAVAERSPERVALAFGDERVTYGELERRANRLAHALVRRGVGPDVLVGLFVERSIEMIVATLGILKAGGAYLPLDLQYPKERLAWMLSDARPAVLLTQSRLAERLPAGDVPLLFLDADRDEIARESAAPLPDRSDPLGLAYVMYTSGSTGRPKGVAAIHRGIVRLVRNTGYAQLDADQVFLQFAPISFDAATLEIWGPLLNGGRLAIMPPDRSSLEEIGSALRKHGVTTLWLTASLFHLMVQDHLEDLAPVKQLLAGGDVLSVPHVERVLRELPGIRLINGYGPTESTTFTCCHPMTGETRLRGSVPIGRPIANTRVHVLDRLGEPVPVGVPGELLIGGDGLVRGYFGRPELTAERFVPNPFPEEPGERLYRTGDLVRWRADGTIEFLGRIDHQVKIRGYRIELGEIETVLLQQNGVKEAAVVVHQDAEGDKRLVAYVVQDAEATADSAAEESEPQQVAHWLELYESTYGQPGAAEDATFNIVGWNSSYTGEAIPAAEMKIWRESTVERILSLRPSRVLEIGCGTGLLLFRVAPSTSRYVATDFSRFALDSIARGIEKDGRGLPQVELLQRMGDDFSGFEEDSFDAVVINSVIQYFPTVDYLLRVIEGAVRVVRPGGSIFLGDIRSLPLLRAFHAAVQLYQAPPELSKAQLRHRVEKQILQEEELVLSPSFFSSLRRQLPKVGGVEIQMKRGRHLNELTQFRYDVVLRIGDEGHRPEPVTLDWRREGLSLAGLRRLIAEESPERLLVRSVPDARVLAALRGLELLTQESGLGTAGEIWQDAQGAGAEGIEPEDLWKLAAELSYTAGIGWTGDAPDGSFDVIFSRLAPGQTAPAEGAGPEVPVPDRPRPWSALANQPLQGRFARDLMPRLRSALAEQLPEHMVPSTFMLLQAMPVSPNGKLNRPALPAPEAERLAEDGAYVAPRTPVEAAIAEMWAEVLALPKVGVYDDFFKQGGHSLMATRIVSRLRERFGVELPLRVMFEARTLAELAEAVEELQLAQADSGDLDRLLAELDELSDDDVMRLMSA